jgi:hypothetical protein
MLKNRAAFTPMPRPSAWDVIATGASLFRERDRTKGALVRMSVCSWFVASRIGPAHAPRPSRQCPEGVPVRSSVRRLKQRVPSA